MDFLTSAILSSAVYDMLKKCIAITSKSLLIHLKGWVVDESTSLKIAEEINKIPNLDDLGEKGLTRNFDENQNLQHLLSEIKVDQSIVQTTQNHYGIGDNVAGNKIISH